jgi:hypothetical protein
MNGGMRSVASLKMMGHDRVCPSKSSRGRWRRVLYGRNTRATFWQVGVEKAEHMRALDYAHAFLLLQIGDASTKPFHFDPVHLRPEMVLGVITVVEKEPVINFAVTADAPGDRLVRVGAVMPVITVQVTKAVAEIEERQKIKNDVAPVEQKHHQERGRESGELDVSPEQFLCAALAQFPSNRAHIVAEETEKDVAPRIFRFAVVTMFVNGNPVDGLAAFIRPIGVAFVMLHVHRVVIGLRKAARDRLSDSKKAIKQLRAEEWVVNEIVAHTVDVRVDHERINEAENQHDPERRVQVEKEQPEEIREMKKARQRRHGVPARVREES